MRINFACEQADVGVPEAYERLIHDAVSGDATFFAHWREVELSREWVTPILEAFAENLLPLHEYESSSYCPDASNELLQDSGFKWWLDQEPEK